MMRHVMKQQGIGILIMALCGVGGAGAAPIPMTPQRLDTSGVVIDYPLAYIACPRVIPAGSPQQREQPARWAEFGHPYAVTPGCDLRLRHPDGTTELLVAGGVGAIQDPAVSLDGARIYYTRFHQASASANAAGADIEVIELATRIVTRLTSQTFAAHVSLPMPYGVYNIHPCPLPDGRIIFTTNRNAYLPIPKSYPAHALQLHRMDADGQHVTGIGMMNLGSALHPTLLLDGHIMFSTLENMGARRSILWGLWRMDPDGRSWGPIWSAFFGANGVHFQTPLADGSLVVEQYYNQNQKGFGALYRIPPPPQGLPAFGPALAPPDAALPGLYGLAPERYPFQPQGLTRLTPWITPNDMPAVWSQPDDPSAPLLGKVTHPHAAPDGHLLVVWSPGPIGGSNGRITPDMGPVPIDSGVYLIRDSGVTTGPADLVEILADHMVNESWPVPVVAYTHLYGREPVIVTPQHDPVASWHLAPGSPFALVGTASLRKRESAPLAPVPPGTVTAVSSWAGQAQAWNCTNQGCDSGVFTNDDIAALRLLFFEPNATRQTRSHPRGFWHYPAYYSRAMERLRYVDLPVRDPATAPRDPDGQPDTSVLAKIPADVPFTFALIDHDGAMLTLSQTWHQARPGEARYDCGGCHAHSQAPTDFFQTVAGQPTTIPVDATGPAATIEFTADIRPILQAKCTGCHAQASPAGGLDLSQTAPHPLVQLPQDYTALVLVTKNATIQEEAIGYTMRLQSRCSPLIWLLGGARPLSCPPAAVPLASATVAHAAILSPDELRRLRAFLDTGAMVEVGAGGLRDDTPPTLVVTEPAAGSQPGPWSAVTFGLHDYQSGIDHDALAVTVHLPSGAGWPGGDLTAACVGLSESRWRCPLPAPLEAVEGAIVRVAAADTVGNRVVVQHRATVEGVVGVPPQITTHPQSVVLPRPCLGTATFTVTATGTPPLRVQWLRNGLVVPGAEGWSYTTECLDQATEPHTVSCRVGNALGEVACDTATATSTLP